MSAALLILFLPACKHDPMWSVDDGSNPTGPNPVDSSIYSGWPCGTDTVYFQNQVLPILISKCAQSGCHDAQSHQDGVVLVDYQSVISSGDIKAYKPNNSKLYKVLVETGDDRMPEPPNPPLSSEQINLIKKWIEQGARNTACNENYGNCDTSGVTYANFIAPLLSSHCTGCHSAINPQGGHQLTTYNLVKTAAENGVLYGAVAHLPGYLPMPNGGRSLSPCFVDKIKAWIDGGMPQ